MIPRVLCRRVVVGHLGGLLCVVGLMFSLLSFLRYILGRVEFLVDVTPTNKCPSFPRICWNSMASHIYVMLYSSYIVIIAMNLIHFMIILL